MVIDPIVPILTQSENWALLNLAKQSLLPENCSNPHPVRKLGAICLFFTAIMCLHGLFQSSPSPKTGRYDDGKRLDSAIEVLVPILTQSENWALCKVRLLAQ